MKKDEMLIDTPRKFKSKALRQLLQQEDLLENEITHEKLLNKNCIDITDKTALIPLTYSSKTSLLNPENNQSSKDREEQRLSPIPVTNKLSIDSDSKPELYFRPIKRIFKSPRMGRSNSLPPVERSSVSSSSDVKMSPDIQSPLRLIGAMALNLTDAGQNFQNMKLH